MARTSCTEFMFLKILGSCQLNILPENTRRRSPALPFRIFVPQIRRANNLGEWRLNSFGPLVSRPDRQLKRFFILFRLDGRQERGHK